MIFSYNWLREYISLPDNPEDLAEIMTFGGIEVEKITPYADVLDKIKIVKVTEVKKHPEADKLVVCVIDTGSESRQVICGAPNCSTGMITAYAPVGVTVSDLEIRKMAIRGEESEGMLCSERDLGISEDHSGIMSLPENAPVGSDLESYLQLRDTVYEVEITPNRPDLLGLLGLARDVGALTGQGLQLPDGFPTDGFDYPQGILEEKRNPSEVFNLINEAPELCSRYIARVIKGVKITDSPAWLKKQLLAAGISPINNLVDITNYVMMEFGHPLHAFDYHLLDSNEIRIRRAKKGEKISALDNKEHELEENDLVIADGTKPVAIAGIIGGKNSSITSNTGIIVLEAANFNNLSVRKTSAKLKIGTDSSYRFERNLSDETVALISKRASDLICEICGGEETHLLDSYPAPQKQVNVKLRAEKVNRLLTTDLSMQEIYRYLLPLGVIPANMNNEGLEGIDSKQELDFAIPAYRKDLSREIDLIEEIIRIHGYNNIPEMEEKETLTDLNWLSTKRYLADYLVHQGFYEAINSSFSEPGILKHFKLHEDDPRSEYFELINPLGASFSMMRTTLIPGLLKNVQYNINNGQNDIKLFELGKVYLKVDGNPEERYYLTGAVSGNMRDRHWKYKTEKSSIFIVKGYVEGLLEKITRGNIRFSPCNVSYYQQGSGIEILFDGKPVGNLGKIDPLLAKSIEIEQPVFIFDVDISGIMLGGTGEEPVYEEINKFPPVARDLSFLIPIEHRHQDIKATISQTDNEMINRVQLIDEFTGKNIPPGLRSLTYNILISSRKGTLTDEAVNELIDRVKARLQNKFNIEMR